MATMLVIAAFAIPIERRSSLVIPGIGLGASAQQPVDDDRRAQTRRKRERRDAQPLDRIVPTTAIALSVRIFSSLEDRVH